MNQLADISFWTDHSSKKKWKVKVPPSYLYISVIIQFWGRVVWCGGSMCTYTCRGQNNLIKQAILTPTFWIHSIHHRHFISFHGRFWGGWKVDTSVHIPIHIGYKDSKYMCNKNGKIIIGYCTDKVNTVPACTSYKPDLIDTCNDLFGSIISFNEYFKFLVTNLFKTQNVLHCNISLRKRKHLHNSVLWYHVYFLHS